MNISYFDRAIYQSANDRIVDLIKNSHDWENTEGFIADGIICIDEYEKQSVRILCILAESYGYEKNGMTPISNEVLGLANKTVMTPRKLATLLWLLQQSFEQGSKVKWDDMPWLFRKEKTAELQNSLSKVAWINVKKASQPHGTKMDSNEVYTHALRNEVVLREQIQAIAANLIIVCGEIPFRAVCEMKLFGPEIKLGSKWKIQNVTDGPRVLEVSHPSIWRGYEKLYRNYENIYTQWLDA